MQVCSSEYLFHTLLNQQEDLTESILREGLRPLSDFPESKRWQQTQSEFPGFFEKIYDVIARPVLQRPYLHSGVFLSPIDFQLLPDSILHNRARVRIPVSRIDSGCACLTYVLDGERVSLPLSTETLREAASVWTADLVKQWFGKDQSMVFFYVPQVAVYQPKPIPVQREDIEVFHGDGH